MTSDLLIQPAKFLQAFPATKNTLSLCLLFEQCAVMQLSIVGLYLVNINLN